MVMELKFSINKFSQVFYRLGPGCRGLTKFIIVDQYIGFPGEWYNFCYNNNYYHYYIFIRIGILEIVKKSYESFFEFLILIASCSTYTKIFLPKYSYLYLVTFLGKSDQPEKNEWHIISGLMVSFLWVTRYFCFTSLELQWIDFSVQILRKANAGMYSYSYWDLTLSSLRYSGAPFEKQSHMKPESALCILRKRRWKDATYSSYMWFPRGCRSNAYQYRLRDNTTRSASWDFKVSRIFRCIIRLPRIVFYIKIYYKQNH
jgi:hypothetical protein